MDESLRACEDDDYVLRAATAGVKFVYRPEARIYYRRHPYSMSANLANQYRHDTSCINVSVRCWSITSVKT